MGDYYQRYLSSMAMVGGGHVASPQDVHVHSMPGVPMHLGEHGAIPNQYTHVGYFSSFPETAHYPPKITKPRRRAVVPGTDYVKHRRTRSGCFTCRSRRVKCDESRPICERCKKGKRECIYPELPPGRAASGSAGSAAIKGSQPTSPTTTDEMGDLDREMENSHLEAIPDADEGDEEDSATELTAPSWPTRRASSASFTTVSRGDNRRSSETPSQDDNSKSSPSASTTTSGGHSDPTHPHSPSQSEWAHLPPDLRQHLDYFCENITNYHYCMSSDVDDFFRTTLPRLAVRHEALLHAVIGFSAFHSTLQVSNGSINNFLRHFNRSLQLLIELFKKKEKPNVGTLLTILQLAMIEEYLGDWVNLLGHQKAALEILMDLFTPHTIMQTPLGRVILLWYLRFDVFVALMGGFQTALPREWFTTMVEYYRAKSIVEPHNLRWKYAFISADLRLLSMEMSLLIARGNKGTITAEEFAAEHDRISVRLVKWKEQMDPSLTDPACLVTDLGQQDTHRTQEEIDNDIVDPYAPGVLYDAPLFLTTEMRAEWNSVMVMHKSQSPNLSHDNIQQFCADLAKHSYDICQIFEAVELWPGTPKGALLLIHAPISIASLFLPPDARHHNWIKRKYALMERMGYIHTLTNRKKMAQLFHDPGCLRWWLPNDAGYTKVLQAVREFADERNAVAQTAQAESIRQVQHLFSKLEILFAAMRQRGRG